jgi:PIN domain nuclease of toxin-antitoxin system
VRLLFAQARYENLTLVSADKVMRAYPVEVLWA